MIRGGAGRAARSSFPPAGEAGVPGPRLACRHAAGPWWSSADLGLLGPGPTCVRMVVRGPEEQKGGTAFPGLVRAVRGGQPAWGAAGAWGATHPNPRASLCPAARPAEPASRTWVSWSPARPSPSVLHPPPLPDLTVPQGMSVICTEVRCSRLADVPATRPKTRSRTHEAPPTLGTSRKPCTTDGTAPAPPTAASSAPQGASGDPNPSASP